MTDSPNKIGVFAPHTTTAFLVCLDCREIHVENQDGSEREVTEAEKGTPKYKLIDMVIHNASSREEAADMLDLFLGGDK